MKINFCKELGLSDEDISYIANTNFLASTGGFIASRLLKYKPIKDFADRVTVEQCRGYFKELISTDEEISWHSDRMKAIYVVYVSLCFQPKEEAFVALYELKIENVSRMGNGIKDCCLWYVEHEDKLKELIQQEH